MTVIRQVWSAEARLSRCQARFGRRKRPTGRCASPRAPQNSVWLFGDCPQNVQLTVSLGLYRLGLTLWKPLWKPEGRQGENGKICDREDEGINEKTNELNVKGTTVRVVKIAGEDFVCLTDMAKSKSDDAQQTISNWMRNRMTIEYLGLWEYLYNPSFKPLEFEGFRNEVGLSSFTMSPSKWIEGVNAIGMVVQAGRYGGTYARNDIAFKVASWLSVEFELYLVKPPG